jgi:hypothetical protein
MENRHALLVRRNSDRLVRPPRLRHEYPLKHGTAFRVRLFIYCRPTLGRRQPAAPGECGVQSGSGFARERKNCRAPAVIECRSHLFPVLCPQRPGNRSPRKRDHFAAMSLTCRMPFKHSSQTDNDRARIVQRMLPDPHYPPPFLAQQPFNSSVSGDISCELHFPILAVAFRGPRAEPAIVPEAAINKDNETLARKCEIWPTGQVRLATPLSYSRRAKQLYEPDLRRGVAPRPDS